MAAKRRRRRRIAVEDTTDGEVEIQVVAEGDWRAIIQAAERAVLQHFMKKYRGNKSQVCKALKIARQSLYNKLNKYGIEVPSERRDRRHQMPPLQQDPDEGEVAGHSHREEDPH